MKLHPYPEVARRRRKVLKHVFDHRERWWEIFGDLSSWHEEYTVLRGLGCIADGWERAVGDASGEGVLDANHARWLGAAETACDEALAAQRVYPSDAGRTCYIGQDGVTVYTSDTQHLATCFRPSQCVGSRRSANEVTQRADARGRRRSGIAQRAAVRRASRRTSLSSDGNSAFEGSEP